MRARDRSLLRQWFEQYLSVGEKVNREKKKSDVKYEIVIVYIGFFIWKDALETRMVFCM